ncbi:MAG: hypothetical protein ACRDV9_07380 [Acidimicrobiia bacterium]
MEVPPKSPPGVEMTPPYEAPTVTSVENLSCVANPHSASSWDVRFNATLVGGRYWTYPEIFLDRVGTFALTIFYARQGGGPAGEEGFGVVLQSLPVQSPSSSLSIYVPISPPISVRCPG